MKEHIKKYPELKIFSNDIEIDGELYRKDSDLCCKLLKVEPIRKAIDSMHIKCWVTGLRCTEGQTRVDFQEIEEKDSGFSQTKSNSTVEGI